jgi:peptide/nickel transport system substrate-binding protein
MSEAGSYWNRSAGAYLNRRRLLKLAAAGGVATAAATLLSCGGDDDKESSGGGKNVGSITGKESLAELQERFHGNNLKNLPGQKDGPKYGGVHKRNWNLPPSWDITSPAASQLAFYTHAHNTLMFPEVHDFAKDLHSWNLEGMLAKSWERAGDTTLVLHLDEAAKWQNLPPVNGRPFVGEDVVYAINAYKRGTIQTFIYRDVDKVEAPDNKTVRMSLKSPAAYLERLLSTPYNWMFSKEQAESPDGLAKRPIGTGAFIFKEGQDRISFTFDKNPEYWKKDTHTGKQLPYVDQYKSFYFADATATIAAFRDKQLDTYLTPDKTVWMDIINNSPEVVSQVSPPPPGYQPSIAVRLDKEPWSDVRLRRAMSMAIDRESIITSYGGLAQPAYCQDWTFFGFDKPWTIEQLGPWTKFDPAQAKQLMSAAGFPNGLGRKVPMWLSGTTGAQNYDIPVLVSDAFRRHINLETELKVAPDQATWFRQWFGKQYEEVAAPGFMTLGSEPDEMSFGLLHSKAQSNFNFINDPLLDDLTIKQGNALDTNERRTILRQIMDRDLDQQYRVFTASLYFTAVRHPYVFNATTLLYGIPNLSQAYQYVWLNRDT